jgi:hypothetical protein
MEANFDTAMRYMKIIQLLDNHIKGATELMGKIANGPEQIICFHLHSHLLYNPAIQPGEGDPYQDMAHPANGMTNGQVIVIQSPISGGMMSPQQIKDLINGGGRAQHGQFFNSKPQTLPAEFASDAFKLDTQLTAAVLQVILDGYKKKKEDYIKKLADLGVNIIFADAAAEPTTADIPTSVG